MVVDLSSWWRHQMEIFSALLAICAGNSPVTCEFPTQRPVTRSFDVFFDLRLNKRLSKQSQGWWFETLLHPLWRQGCISRMLESYCHRSLQYTSYFCILYEYPHPHPANIYYKYTDITFQVAIFPFGMICSGAFFLVIRNHDIYHVVVVDGYSI